RKIDICRNPQAMFEFAVGTMSIDPYQPVAISESTFGSLIGLMPGLSILVISYPNRSPFLLWSTEPHGECEFGSAVWSPVSANPIRMCSTARASGLFGLFGLLLLGVCT